MLELHPTAPTPLLLSTTTPQTNRRTDGLPACLFICLVDALHRCTKRRQFTCRGKAAQARWCSHQMCPGSSWLRHGWGLFSDGGRFSQRPPASSEEQRRVGALRPFIVSARQTHGIDASRLLDTGSKSPPWTRVDASCSLFGSTEWRRRSIPSTRTVASLALSFPISCVISPNSRSTAAALFTRPRWPPKNPVHYNATKPTTHRRRECR